MRQTHPTAIDEFKNAYNVEFLGIAPDHSEADLHDALLRNLGRFLTELGRDFCFVGSQYPVQVGNQDFSIDLVFFHRGLQSYAAGHDQRVACVPPKSAELAHRHLRFECFRPSRIRSQPIEP